ncbi:esterase-like activity of phytase family protein [Geitlerinema sp. PCC 9228]|uniref:esterase-like activity of phytase family protein n=1 Tax=Geitlerinema sp. PCC 9228 TaxID=111611 RepID=UPI0008F9A7AF|nr:esterase-like activity of phytase family protein [Geitlerinema sp. PCC 9228]
MTEQRWISFPVGRWLLLFFSLLLAGTLTACSLPQVTAQERIFPQLSLTFLDEYQLPPKTFEDTVVGGLSAIAYRQNQPPADTSEPVYHFYALSDDSGAFATPRFYELGISFQTNEIGQVEIGQVSVEGVTQLRDEEGELLPGNSLDPEGMAISPRDTLYISSEGLLRQDIGPAIEEYEPQTGRKVGSVPIPERYFATKSEDQKANQESSISRGVRENRGFESLTIDRSGAASSREPWRLFAATETSLAQDKATAEAEHGERARLLHYLVVDNQPQLIAEHAYELDTPALSVFTGLSELLTLGNGNFLALERSLGLFGYRVKIYQMETVTATDTSFVPTLKGTLDEIRPIRKRLVLDLKKIGIPVDNLEGMTLGPRLPDGSRSLLLISDNNFEPEQNTQILLFRLQMDSK